MIIDKERPSTGAIFFEKTLYEGCKTYSERRDYRAC